MSVKSDRAAFRHEHGRLLPPSVFRDLPLFNGLTEERVKEIAARLAEDDDDPAVTVEDDGDDDDVNPDEVI